MAYSIDYRKRAVAYKQEGHNFKELYEAFQIHPESYYRWKRELENGSDEPKPKQERSRKIDKEQLRQAVEEQPDAYLHELAEPFNCTPQAVFYALKTLEITLKKRPLHTPKNLKKNERSI